MRDAEGCTAVGDRGATSTSAGGGGGGDGGETRADVRLRSPLDVGVVYEDPEWWFERSVERREDVAVGAVVRFGKVVSEADVHGFGLVTGDTNRLHFDEAYAARTRFDGRVVHGLLTSGVVSAALARLPGTAVYLSQTMEFLAPVRVGDGLTGTCEVVEDLGEDRYRLRTTVRTQRGERVLAGEAVVLLDRPA